MSRAIAWRRRVRASRLIGVALGLWLCAVPSARAESYAELEVRAVYLYNFAAFIRWPEGAFESSSAPLRYCVLANRVLQANLRTVLEGEEVQGHPFELVSDEEPTHWSRCHLLYVDYSFQSLARRVVTQTAGHPVVTVSDSAEFPRSGGMMALVRMGGRLRTYVNREATAAAGIRISSKLLRIATLVDGSDAGGPGRDAHH